MTIVKPLIETLKEGPIDYDIAVFIVGKNLGLFKPNQKFATDCKAQCYLPDNNPVGRACMMMLEKLVDEGVIKSNESHQYFID